MPPSNFSSIPTGARQGLLRDTRPLKCRSGLDDAKFIVVYCRVNAPLPENRQCSAEVVLGSQGARKILHRMPRVPQYAFFKI